jgi:hypothetical protein
MTLQLKRPNGRKICQHLSLQDNQKFTQIGIFGLKIGIPSGNPVPPRFPPLRRGHQQFLASLLPTLRRSGLPDGSFSNKKIPNWVNF